MNRPKKNKAKNPTLPEDQQIDERNLVDAEESEEISIEDRIHMYWMENKGFISGCITVLALGIIAINGMRIYSSHAEAKIQGAYAEAVANDTLENFANDYSGKPLGGLAALEVADTAYGASEYEKAAEFYTLAGDALNNDLLVGRAQLGLAFALFYKGDREAGISQLKAIASDTSLSEAVRSEAAYHLAVDADVAGDSAAFESYANQVSSSTRSGQWQQRMQAYQRQP
jgi:predicted negative regulator of RcsB-dependent stress response